MAEPGKETPPDRPADRLADGPAGRERPHGCRRRRSIVLVGMMGAGKSAIGRRLAPRLGLPFVDADSEIERAAGCSIQDFFDAHGEAAFRDGERRVIARLLGGDPIVLATGGGAMMDPDTRRTIAESSLSIWLRADIETLLSRVARRGNRPLLKKGDPREVLTRLLEKRNPHYAEADIVVESTDAPVTAMVEQVAAAIEAFETRGEQPSRERTGDGQHGGDQHGDGQQGDGQQGDGGATAPDGN